MYTSCLTSSWTTSQPVKIVSQEVPRMLHSYAPKMSLTDPIWSSLGPLDVTPGRRPPLTSRGRPNLTPQECTESTFQGRPSENVVSKSLEGSLEDVFGTMWCRLMDVRKFHSTCLSKLNLSSQIWLNLTKSI